MVKLTKIFLFIISCSPLAVQSMHDPELNQKLLEQLREQQERALHAVQEYDEIYPEYAEHKGEKKYI